MKWFVALVVLSTGLIFYNGSPHLDAKAAGASSDYGKTVCAYLKTRAMRAQTDKRKKALMAEYKRCLKEQGEG